jgi:hypothetical protein
LSSSATHIDDRAETVDRLEQPGVSAIEVAVSIIVAFDLAIAYPILDLLGRNAEFFVAHDASRWTVVVIGLLLVVVAPLAIVSAILLIARFSCRTASVIHWVVMAILIGAFAVQVLKRTPLDGAAPPIPFLAVALGVGATVSWAWSRYGRSDSRLMLFGLGVPVVVLALFAVSGVRGILLPAAEGAAAPVDVGNPTPVVLVVFDETPLGSILNQEMEIDAEMFPNFASLAEDGTWYRNATSVDSHTRWAVPAILTGRTPPRGTLPMHADHPDNLFTLLGDSYRVQALEPMTALCPASVCEAEPVTMSMGAIRAILSDIGIVGAHLLSPEEWTERLPAIDERWANFRQAAEEAEPESFEWNPDARLDDLVGQFRAWLGGLPLAGGDDQLFFAHSLLAHKPWRYLPSGHEYPNILFTGFGEGGWTTDPWLMAQAYQRHLLQIQAADTMLGELLDALKSNDTYERALIVVTADHGLSMKMGEAPRVPTGDALVGISAVPMIVKYPGQDEGAVDDKPVQTIDILPTIADVLEMEPLPPMEGMSMLSESGWEATPPYLQTGARNIDVPEDLSEPLAAIVNEKHRLLGDADGGIFSLTPPGTGDLLGRSISELSIESGLAPFGAEVLRREGFDDVDFDSAFLPALVGVYLDTRLAEDEQVLIAVAVNDRVAAVSRTLSRGSKRRNSELTAMVDPSFLRPGHNDVTLYLVEQSSDGEHVLTPIQAVVVVS